MKIRMAWLLKLIQKDLGMAFLGGRKKRFQERVQEKKFFHRKNEKIRAPQLRVVDEKGDLLGVMSREEALDKAKALGLDLVEISPKAEPPVAKIIDYGKMLYALKKKDQQAKKVTKATEIKGVRLSFRMDVGDMDRQKKHAEEFLLDHHPVRVQMVLKGREKAHKDLAFEKMKGFLDSFSSIASVDQTPAFAGFQIVAILKPIGKSST